MLHRFSFFNLPNFFLQLFHILLNLLDICLNLLDVYASTPLMSSLVLLVRARFSRAISSALPAIWTSSSSVSMSLLSILICKGSIGLAEMEIKACLP